MKNGYAMVRRLKLTPFELRVAIEALNAKRLKQKANGIDNRATSITTNVGGGGGVHIDDRYRLGMKYLSDEQAELLERLSETLEGNCLVIILDILKTFRRPTV